MNMFGIKTGSLPAVKVGDKLMVSNLNGYDCSVKSIAHLLDERVEITLDWGQFGISKVYLHDYGKTWNFKVEVN